MRDNICVKQLIRCKNGGDDEDRNQQGNGDDSDGNNRLDFLFDPRKIPEGNSIINLDKVENINHFKSIDLAQSYDSLFEILWYTQLPCFDVKGVTSQYLDQYGMLKSCRWKGKCS